MFSDATKKGRWRTEKSETRKSADDGDPGSGGLPRHYDAVCSGAPSERSGARRGARGRQENLSGRAARCVGGRPHTRRYFWRRHHRQHRAEFETDGNIKVLVDGEDRATLVSVSDEGGFFRATVRTSVSRVDSGPRLDASCRFVARAHDLAERARRLARHLADELVAYGATRG